ncbi:MAG: SDR family NAD(P)-dependent oxidoreductase [Burkholderiales bacterium]|nr:SDR family NAD(P)-dependent oxidoreductase [Burkholderiales bacterium]
MPSLSRPIVAISPFETPDVAVVRAACRAGALGVLDVGRDPARARAAIADLASFGEDAVGLRVPDAAVLDGVALPPCVGAIVVDAGAPLARWREAGLTVLVQVTSVAEAQAAAAAGADGLIAKGAESGGRVGEETSLVLLQALAGAATLPVWVQGGVGLHTAAACIAGGAAGVVLDAQLSLARESTLPPPVRSAVAAMDGSETALIAGHRVYTRPDLPVRAQLPAAEVRALLGGRDLVAQLLPAGQDAAFARPLADRFRTVGGIVRGVAAAIAHGVAAAREQQALGEGAPLAARLTVRYPIFQGPMTRVSDRAPFAQAVAEAGAVPFLALALMRGAEVEALLTETAQRLAGRTWGVGILGFVPAELREEQLEVVRRIKPPVALIAGGRPAQAQPLQDLGIATFLHTPSPGLLDLFLKQGARRFVFEGMECGGHVGPRSSLVLWEQQVARLLAHPDPSELEIVFAGGIHDGRSAAMVAALAAPLVERGAAIGVLMGTAYLFTREAVAAGAIEAGFQQTALACTETVLLETAPGHATRCADTDYVRAFRAERERLQREGVPAQAMWQALEELNLGRLRIAAKGVRRDGDALVRVDADVQRREGMVMLGQVAALRAGVTTVAQLHRDVVEGAGAQLAAAAGAAAARSDARPADIAIVGMAAILPGAPDLDAFWANVVAGVNSIREVPADRWRVDEFYDGKSMNGEMTPSKWGGFLDPYPFDPLAYGIPPTSLSAIEPVQLLALEVSRRALADAGYATREFDRENTSVIFGAEAGTDLAGAYGFRAFYRQLAGPLPPAFEAVLPRLTEDSFPGILSNVISGRIANRLDLGGSNFTVDAACASSLAAVDLACKELATGNSNVVICGGADLHNSITDYLVFASVHALSPSGQCRTFDAAADGITLGEGVVAIVLKRLADAERDGDRVYAVIKGVGGGSDGKSLGLTAPRAQGQQRTLARAYKKAGVAPAKIGLVEAHGTGTVVGDRTELETLNGFFGSGGAAPGSIALGSIKSQIGHTKCTAGVAGLVKAALALHRRVLPPTLNIERPNPGWSPESPFTLSNRARPWPGRARLAGVSAFGFGGTHFHAVLEAYEGTEPESGGARWPAELILLRGTDRADALARADAVVAYAASGAVALRDVARSASAGDAPVQVALVARDAADLAHKVGLARAGTAHASGVFLRDAAPAEGPRKVAFLFPGQGSQRVGMLSDLFLAFPELQRHLEHGQRWRDVMFPPTAWTPEEAAAQKRALTDTRVAQPALGIAGLALADLLARLGVRADMMAGHSYGELVALAAAGALPAAALPALSERRGVRILDACIATGDAGTMAAVGGAAADVARAIADFDGVVVANENAPDQTVISGPTGAVVAATAHLAAAGMSARTIPVACAFHSPLAHAACAAFAADLAEIEVAAPAQVVYSNTTADAYPADAGAVRARLAEHIGKPVRFASEIEAMYAAGARIFVEAGPGRVLTGLVGKVLRGRPHVAVACDRDGEHGVVQLLLALGELAAHGVPVQADALYAGRDAKVVDLAAPPPARVTANGWWIDGQRAWPMHGEPPAHALRPVRAPVVIAAQAAAAAGDDRQAAVLEYLRNMRELVETQRRVMLGYLGAADAPSRAPIDVVASPVVEPPAVRADVPAADAAPAAASARAAETRAPADIAHVLLSIVAQRTGYPTEMLELDLDLEADLSIDSIKRVEILGAVAEHLGQVAGGGVEQLPENLVAIKTLRGIIDALRPLVAGAAATPAAAADAAAAAPATRAEGAPDAAAPAVERYVVELAPTRRANGAWSLADRAIGIVGAVPSLQNELLDGLAAAGSRGHAQDDNTANGSLDALVDLTPMRADWSADDVPALFGRVRHALVSGASHVLVAGMAPAVNGAPPTGALAPPAAGVSGMIKSLSKEWPDRQLRFAYFLPRFGANELARTILDELNSADDADVVEYSREGERRVPRVVAAERNGGDGAGVALGRESVVLLTGGARGITARIALELARRFGCRLELVGRTPQPAAMDDADLRDAGDEVAVRRALIARGGRRPAEIEAECARVMAAREVRSTLAALAAAGATPAYHQVDVRDADAVAALVARIYAERGRLDGVIHGAGVIEDKLARDKTPESFARVFDTKVNGALAIARSVRDDVGFIVFFSSIAATFGNRGQSDYAAANDYLDRLAATLKRRLPGRVLSINWGPWGGAGMVSPELEREYAKRGIGLIDPDAGAATFVDELLHGPADDAQVILMRGDPARLM